GARRRRRSRRKFAQPRPAHLAYSAHPSRSPAMLTPTQFEALLDRHGSDLSKWPHAERDQAKQLLQVDTAAKTLLDQHQELATLLDSVPRVSPSANLRRAVAEVPLQRQTKQSALLRAVQWLL